MIAAVYSRGLPEEFDSNPRTDGVDVKLIRDYEIINLVKFLFST